MRRDWPRSVEWPVRSRTTCGILFAAIVANAEFLCESHLSTDQREELYQEIRIAVNQMTELIDSLLEFSRTRESLRRTYGSVKESVDRVVQAVRTHPRFHAVRIAVRQEGNCIGWFDTKKLERALYNLLLNACEAIAGAGEDGRINIDLREVPGGLQIRLSDNGRGIPSPFEANFSSRSSAMARKTAPVWG